MKEDKKFYYEFIEATGKWHVLQKRMGGQPKTICQFRTERGAKVACENRNRLSK